jgi:hypothetical protein
MPGLPKIIEISKHLPWRSVRLGCFRPFLEHAPLLLKQHSTCARSARGPQERERWLRSLPRALRTRGTCARLGTEALPVVLGMGSLRRAV